MDELIGKTDEIRALGMLVLGDLVVNGAMVSLDTDKNGGVICDIEGCKVESIGASLAMRIGKDVEE